jgi:hypothetical protein
MPAIRCARLCSPTSQPESHSSLGWLRPSDDAVISRVADDELEIVDTDGNACFRLVEIPAKKVLRTRQRVLGATIATESAVEYLLVQDLVHDLVAR